MMFDEQGSSHTILRSAIDTIRHSKDPFLVKQCFRVFKAWGFRETVISFFDSGEVLALWQEKSANPTDTVALMMDMLEAVKECDHYSDMCLSIARNTSSFLLRHHHVSVLHNVCLFLMKHPQCIPDGDDLYNFCVHLGHLATR